MAQRPEMRCVHARATAEEVLDRLADLTAERAGGIHPIYSVMYAAQDGYSEIAELVELIEQQRLSGAAAPARTIADRLDIDALAKIAELRDAIWAAMSLVHYEMLVVKRSWPVERYREWVRAALQIPVDWLRGGWSQSPQLRGPGSARGVGRTRAPPRCTPPSGSAVNKRDAGGAARRAVSS
jgi:hypothetical protein